jgi:hypothetical protein
LCEGEPTRTSGRAIHAQADANAGVDVGQQRS